jgi:hypothetical protein
MKAPHLIAGEIKKLMSVMIKKLNDPLLAFILHMLMGNVTPEQSN